MNRLTDRQRQVAELIADGFTDPQIQAKLGISYGTLRCHFGLICERLSLDLTRNLRVQIAWLVIDDRYDRDPQYRHPPLEVRPRKTA